MEIIIERGKIVKLSELGDYSIALDGFVQGPQIDAEHHRFSFDHHAKCFRFSTLASCQQAWSAVMLGLDPEPYSVYCNDVDVDVCASVWCLKNSDRCNEPLVSKLIDAIGKGDAYAGAFETNGMRKTVEWICAPETESRRNGDYEKLSNDGLNPIMESILHRIGSYVDGNAASEIAKYQTNTEFKILNNENGWVLIETQDPHALAAIWQAGFDKAVLIRPLADKSTAVTFAKRSDFIEGFNLNKIYKSMNELEPGAGGGSTIGGCVRNADGSRSRLSIKQIVYAVNRALGLVDVKAAKSVQKQSRPPRRASKAKKKAVQRSVKE